MNIIDQSLLFLYRDIRYGAELAWNHHPWKDNHKLIFAPTASRPSWSLDSEASYLGGFERRTILTSPKGNPKLRKSLFPIYGITLAPASSSGVQLCIHRSKYCEEGCLGAVAGRARFNTIREARIKKSRFLFEKPYDFFRNLYSELDRVCERSNAEGICPALRCNVLSDLPWHSLCPWIENYLIRRYDYTKCLPYLSNHPLIHYTFSYSGTNADNCKKAFDLGVNVAVVCTKEVKEECLRTGYVYAFGEVRPCLDGDVSEARWLDPEGHVVLLRGKGKIPSSPFLVKSVKEFP